MKVLRPGNELDASTIARFANEAHLLMGLRPHPLPGAHHCPTTTKRSVETEITLGYRYAATNRWADAVPHYERSVALDRASE